MPPRATAKSPSSTEPTPIKKAAAQETLPTADQGVERSRIVTRYVAECPFEGCPFNARTARKGNTTKDAAIVETIRHLRESDHLQPREVKANRLAVVLRTVVSETIIDEPGEEVAK